MMTLPALARKPVFRGLQIMDFVFLASIVILSGLYYVSNNDVDSSIELTTYYYVFVPKPYTETEACVTSSKLVSLYVSARLLEVGTGKTYPISDGNIQKADDNTKHCVTSIFKISDMKELTSGDYQMVTKISITKNSDNTQMFYRSPTFHYTKELT